MSSAKWRLFRPGEDELMIVLINTSNQSDARDLVHNWKRSTTILISFTSQREHVCGMEYGMTTWKPQTLQKSMAFILTMLH